MRKMLNNRKSKSYGKACFARIAAVILCCMTVMPVLGCGAKAEVSAPAEEIVPKEQEEVKPEILPEETNTEEEVEVSEAESEEEIASEPLRLAISNNLYENFSQKEGDTYVTYAHAEAHFCYVDKNFVDSYPELAASLEASAAEKEAALRAEYDDIVSTIQDCIQTGEDTRGEWFTERVPSIIRCDDNIVSILEGIYSYTGGAHPNSAYFAEVYDTKTGKRLTLKDVVKDTSALKPVLLAAIQDQYPEAAFFDLENAIDTYFAGMMDSLNWTVDNESMTFYFSPYDIAPYAQGLISANIPFKGNEALFADNVLAAPKAYAMSFDKNIPVYVDVADNGDTGKLEVSFYPVNDWGDGTLCVYLDEKSILEEPLYSYNCSFYLLKGENGKNFLYVTRTQESDYRSTCIYEVSENEAKYVYEIDASAAGYYDVETEKGYNGTISSPLNFVMSTRTDALFTGSGIASYYLGDDGIPVQNEDYYSFPEGYELTVIKDIDVHLLNEDDFTQGDEVTLKEGDKITIIRTDNLSFIDALLTDGRCVRINVVLDTWPPKVEDKDVEDYFTGMMYAG